MSAKEFKRLYGEIDQLKQTISDLESRKGIVSLSTHAELEENHQRGIEVIRERDKEIQELKKEIRMLKSENFALKSQLAASNEKSKRPVGRPAQEERLSLIRELKQQGLSIRDIQKELLNKGITASVGLICKAVKGGNTNEM